MKSFFIGSTHIEESEMEPDYYSQELYEIVNLLKEILKRMPETENRNRIEDD
jgi:hypothetical protein